MSYMTENMNYHADRYCIGCFYFKNGNRSCNSFPDKDYRCIHKTENKPSDWDCSWRQINDWD